MISFESDHYSFLSFSENRMDHLTAKEELAKDFEVLNYLKDSVDLFLNEDDGLDFSNSAYLVSRDDRICGYICLFDYNEYIEMHYAVLNEFRGYKYSLTETTGCQILKEASDVIFDRVPYINFLKLDISVNNIKSKRAALNAGYNLVNKNFQFEEFHKYR